jgi:hypothetical protein
MPQPKLVLIMISCDKAAIICNKTQYREATFLEMLKLRFHLFICKNCSKATKQNTKFTSLCDKAKLHSFSRQEKLKMKEKLKTQA